MMNTWDTALMSNVHTHAWKRNGSYRNRNGGLEKKKYWIAYNQLIK
jgi:hypothetical protein